jgi:hypothetical protein
VNTGQRRPICLERERDLHVLADYFSGPFSVDIGGKGEAGSSFWADRKLELLF